MFGAVVIFFDNSLTKFHQKDAKIRKSLDFTQSKVLETGLMY